MTTRTSTESALEGAQSGVNVGAPLVVIEHWTIGPPAAIAVHEEPIGDEIFVEELPSTARSTSLWTGLLGKLVSARCAGPGRRDHDSGPCPRRDALFDAWHTHRDMLRQVSVYGSWPAG